MTDFTGKMLSAGSSASLKERILLMDHTKFGPSANVLFGSLDLVDLIITDEPVSAQWEAVKAKSHLRIEICREDGGRSGRRPL